MRPSRRLQARCLLTLAAIWSLGTAAAPTPLILISIDGYRADYLGRGDSPVLAGLAADGVRAAAMRPVFPSLTYPNHYTMVTGVYPDKHGIINNTMRDPVLGDFAPGNAAANEDARWWNGAEPIWVTAQRQGLHTASIFWPGSQAPIRGVRPTYWRPYDPTIPPAARVDQVLAWLDLPAARRPQFVTLYFEQLDTAGHSFGPDSPEVKHALATVDAAVGRLVAGLRQRHALAATNLIFVADHGMLASAPDRIVLLDSIVNIQHLDLVSSLVVAGINPAPAYTEEVAAALLAPHAHLRCWHKADLPPRFHYGKNARIPAFICIAEPGWMVSTAAAEAHRAHPLLGEHGYDPDEPRMQALFAAHGPAFRHHLLVPEFDNVNVYPLLARLLDVKPVGDDGSLREVAAMLVSHR